MSAAVSTATTPGAARTGVEIDAEQLPGRDRRAADRDVQQALRLADVVDVARLPATCFGAESCAHRRRTTRSRNSSARRSSCTDIRRLPVADDRGSAASTCRRSRSAPCAAARAPPRRDSARSRAGRRSARSPRRAPRSPSSQSAGRRICFSISAFSARARALRDRRHAAEGDARAGDARAVERAA